MRTLIAVLLTLILTACASLGRRASLAYMAVASELAPDNVHIEMRRDFVETYKNRVTIATQFTVDAVAGAPNPSAFDGDLHFSGRAPEVGLRLVGEIKNAAAADSAVALVRRAARVRGILAVTGAWRIWPEHSLGSREAQGQPLRQLESPYPDHVFEVHPVTRVGSVSLLESLRVLDGYKPGSAKSTFASYQAASCTVSLAGSTVVLRTSSWLYNDVHFVMEILEDASFVAADGRFDTARALAPDGTPLVERLRMVFVAGSGPERLVRARKAGDRLHIWGLPRLDLAEISRRITASGGAETKGPLPYEIVVIGVYP